MIRDDDRFLALIDSFQRAALDGNWYPALEALARATGSRSGQLIALGADATVPLNLLTDVPEEMVRQFVECNGGDPAVNPRVRAGMDAPVLRALAEEDFITRDEYDRNPHYQEFAVPADVPYICLATLDRTADLLVGLAVLRSKEQGHITREQRDLFQALAPHVRSAVRLHMQMAGNGEAVLADAMDALAIPAFVCDSAGVVKKLTAAAEKLVDGESGLELRQGRLTAKVSEDTQALESAIRAVSHSALDIRTPATRTVVVRGAADDPALVLDVAALPSSGLHPLLGTRVLVAARGPRGEGEQKSALLQNVYGLTAAEADVASYLIAGRNAAAIAAARGVAVGTVRLQIKALLSKVGVNRQAELVAKLGQL
ncbi:DNA-binding CsgD family transcriptional regulator [Povalibacter uvarum]|uniref:DNA-binding CsgD family transcriptional regulator n=1 Tax=Povalibacter uvarum TaxID=732238 RepID=A0A841HVB1_9GAMM|nr:hypothetical protein [Povalibacter uvarum]MBB6095755.1 DNA-binding CsgD family transcriptional regulator [Povalibacter uvarum]